MVGDTPAAAVLVGVGCPILDIKAAVPESFLSSRGLALGQFYVADQQRIRTLCDDAVASGAVMQFSAGGSTQNVVRVAQWLLGADDGRCKFLGSVGDDDWAQLLRREVARDSPGVALEYVISEGCMTGSCLALTLLNDAEDRRHQLFAAGASEKIAAVPLPQSTMRLIEEADFLYLECAFLSFAEDLLFNLAAQHVSHNKCVVANLSNISVVKKYAEAILRLLPMLDVLFAKEKEALVLTNTSSPLDAAAHLSLSSCERRGERIVVVTRGTQPTIVGYRGECTTYPVPAVPEERIVDFIGSGDAFVGGFIAEFVRYYHRHQRQRPGPEAMEAVLVSCVAGGHFASGEVIQHAGCTFSADAASTKRNC